MSNYFETITEKFTFPKEDTDWINCIYQYLIQFYVENQSEKFSDKTENQITDEIYLWLKNMKKFTSVVSVASQPKTDNQDIEGYYDLKFESTLWNEGQTHFAIENKILVNSETSFKNYIYYPNKTKGTGENKKQFDDGGMFRFLSNKYANKQPYGGMLAFVKENEINKIGKTLKTKIKTLTIKSNGKEYGYLIDDNLLNAKIQDFEYSFQTNHIRRDGTDIHLFHLLFLFN